MVIKTLGEGQLCLTPHYFFQVRNSTDPHREAGHLRTFLFFNPGEGELHTWLRAWGLWTGQSKWSPGACSLSAVWEWNLRTFPNLKGNSACSQYVMDERPGRETEIPSYQRMEDNPRTLPSGAVTSHRGVRDRWGPGRVICIVVRHALLTQLRNPTKLPGLDLTCLPLGTLVSFS